MQLLVICIVLSLLDSIEYVLLTENTESMNQLHGSLQVVELTSVLSLVTRLHVSQSYLTPIVPDTITLLSISFHCAQFVPSNLVTYDHFLF